MKSTKEISGKKKAALLGERVRHHGGKALDGAIARKISAGLDQDLRSIRVSKTTLTEEGRNGDGDRIPAPSSVLVPESPVAATPPASQPAPTEPAFDPFSIKVIAVLKADGPDALLAKLTATGSAANLLAVAKANNLAVAEDVRAAGQLDAIAKAVLASAMKRVQGMRAVAGSMSR
ncbi:MAG: hypothetical protein ACKVP7_03275 [Hyphomicrobiaceae bacterium]